MSAVQEIDKKAATAPALGFSQQVDLGAGRTAVFQTHLPSDCSLAELNAMLDKMCAASDRLRAHYKIEERERDIEILENEQRQHDEDLAAVDKRFAEDQAKLGEQLNTQEQARGNFLAAGEEAHQASGRRGKYEPKGAEKNQVNVVERNIEQLRAEIAKGKTEHDITHEKAADLRKRRSDLLAKHRQEIKKCEQIKARGLVANDG